MEKILTPENINLTTRFYFEKRLNKNTLKRLVCEFFPDAIIDNENLQTTYKHIDSNNKTSIEITRSYISFFPEITENQKIEQLRERIYRIVAKKNEVYHQTALDNLELALSSILSGNLRSTANLLYYSLHKFFSGLMYSFLNSELELSDEEIKIQELNHFGSRKFMNNLKTINSDPKEINSTNYLEILNSRTNPFTLSRYIFKQHHLESIEDNFAQYLNYYLITKYNISIEDPDIIANIDLLISNYSSLQKQSEFDEVDLAIITAANKYLENQYDDEGLIYLVDLLAIRLYWLRQTADYDYDFEVKTSIRELSIISACIKSLFEACESNDIDPFESLLSALDPADISESTENEKSISIKNYSVDISFPENIKFPSKYSKVYLTAVHLEPYFNREEIFSTMNLMDGVENHGKYFKVLGKTKKEKHYYLHLNPDGRWFIWIDNPYDKFEVELYLINSFNNFIITLYQKYQSIFSNKLKCEIISSNIHYENTEYYDNKLFKLYYNQKFLRKEVLQIEESISKLLAQLFNVEYNSKVILFPNFNVFCNLVLDDNVSSNPILSNILDSLRKKIEYNFDTSGILFFNIYLNDFYKNINSTQLNNLMDLLDEQITRYLDQNFQISENKFQSMSVVTNINELEHSISNDQINVEFEQRFYRLLNNFIYQQLKSDVVNDSFKSILENITLNTSSNNYYQATLGMWYFRNKNLSVQERLQVGSNLYSQAIEAAPKFHDLLEYKYTYELALCCLDCGYLDAAEYYFKQISSESESYNEEEQVNNLLLEIESMKAVK
ncbi:hypothetical protein A9986_00920 [Solibacillus silvestris]|nr:hypothetical protein [Solibacillus silvestris]OBW59768.1 hypothetical protein A9986_00920 [Solibacillus silvestris]